MNTIKKKIDIIIPVYENEGSIKPLFTLLKENIIVKHDYFEYKIIFIDDGSDDKSFLRLNELKERYPQLISIIKLTRNFGQVFAIYAGYSHSEADLVLNISADLQDPIELVDEICRTAIKSDYEVIIGIREDRDESYLRSITSRIFYKIMKKLSFDSMPINGFDVALITKRIKEIILTNGESNPFWQGQLLWLGFDVFEIPYTRKKRHSGKSKWTFRKKIKYLLDGVLAYSYFPIRFMSFFGFIIFFLGCIYGVAVLVSYFLGEAPFKGWTPIVLLLVTFSGLQMIMLGIIGEYLWRNLDQSRKRPLYIIEKIIE